jgi:3',5'-cyclic-AMP phosphodiesterase
MATVIAQISDIHIGGPNAGSGERLSQAIDEINAMSRVPDLVLLTGDVTQNGAPAEWDELQARLSALRPRCEVMPGNHDSTIAELAGHRSIEVGDLHVVLVDSSVGEFVDDDAAWLDQELAEHPDHPTAIAIHHPPFETGIWWMDCVGLVGAERFERVVRRHPHVRHVMSGHIHRPIVTAWAGCLLTVCPSTSVAVAGDLDPAHDPAETAEPPMIALHAYLADTVVSHVVTVGAAGTRTSISAASPEFVAWARDRNAARPSGFTPT